MFGWDMSFHMSSQSLEKQLSEEVLFSATTESYRENDRHYSFSLTWKHDDFAFFVFDHTNPNLSRGFADSPIPQETVCLLT